MKDPIVLRRKDILLPEDTCYWKDLLYRVIKIGTELEVAPPKGIDRAEFEASIRDSLAPSGSLDTLGLNGVLNVNREHCGIELRVIGRQPNFRALQKQYTVIMNVLEQKGARTRPTCGLHFHLLTPGLAEPIPEIVLANLWNLTRRYAPELRFLYSGGASRQALCRRRNHTSHLEMIRLSPATMTMEEIQRWLKQSHIVPEHQNFLNLEHIGFLENGVVLPFHLEFRFPDADLSAISVTAKTFFFMALALKAVDLSQYGVIHVGKIVPWRRKTQLLDWLSNNDGDLATSNTSMITDDVVEELRQGSHEMLDLLAPAFEWFHDGVYQSANPALEILRALAERPVSLLRCAGYGWSEIDALLSNRAELDDHGLDQVDHQLMRYIEFGEWADRSSPDAWQWHAARELYLTPHDLERRLEKLRALRGLRWDDHQGTMVFSQ